MRRWIALGRGVDGDEAVPVESDRPVAEGCGFVDAVEDAQGPEGAPGVAEVEPAMRVGGELVIEDTYGVQTVKLPAGHLVLYPSTSLHHVRPVTRGARICSFFWIQSMIRDDGQRTLLFDLDMAIQRLNQDHADHPSAVQLTGVYHNLLRRWAEV